MFQKCRPKNQSSLSTKKSFVWNKKRLYKERRYQRPLPTWCTTANATQKRTTFWTKAIRITHTKRVNSVLLCDLVLRVPKNSSATHFNRSLVSETDPEMFFESTITKMSVIYTLFSLTSVFFLSKPSTRRWVWILNKTRSRF